MDEDETESVKVGHSYESYYAIGHALLKVKNYKKAIWYLTKAVDEKNSKVRAQIERAQCYLALYKFDEALSDVKNALNRDVNNKFGLFLLGQIYYEKGEFEIALIHFQKGLKNYKLDTNFYYGIRKSEDRIKTSCGKEYLKNYSQLNDELLQEFYDKAFPEITEMNRLKNEKKMATKNIKKKKEKPSQIVPRKLPPIVPKPKFKKQTVRFLLKKEAKDRFFFNDLDEIEDKRLSFLNTISGVPKDMNQLKQKNCRDIQETLIDAALYLDNKSQFYFQENPHEVLKNYESSKSKKEFHF